MMGSIKLCTSPLSMRYIRGSQQSIQVVIRRNITTNACIKMKLIHHTRNNRKSNSKGPLTIREGSFIVVRNKTQLLVYVINILLLHRLCIVCSEWVILDCCHCSSINTHTNIVMNVQTHKQAKCAH
mgnify:CR=1 FL=1